MYDELEMELFRNIETDTHMTGAEKLKHRLLNEMVDDDVQIKRNEFMQARKSC